MRYLQRIIILIIIVEQIFAEEDDQNSNIQLGQTIKNSIRRRQNLEFKIETCDDIEIEITSNGGIIVESGPARSRSIKGFQNDIKTEINNTTKSFDVTFPFIYYNIQNRLCLIYLSVYGSAEEATKEFVEFSFIARPKKFNEIEVISSQNITKSSSIIYTNTVPYLNEKIFIFEESELLNMNLKFTIYQKLQISSQINQDKELNEQQPEIALPNIIIGKDMSTLANKKGKKKQQNQLNQEEKNTFLNLNLQQNVLLNTDKLVLLVENKQNYYENIFQITESNTSQFQALSNLQQLQFSGLNFSFKKGNRQKILLNNVGSYLLEIYTLKPKKLNVYFNQLTNSNVNAQQPQGKQELKTINEYTSYVLLPNIRVEDLIELDCEEDIKVLIELKPYTNQILKQYTDERSEYLNFSVDDYIIKIDQSDIQLVYLFVSDKEDIATKNSIIGESSQGLILFKQINPTGYELHSLLDQLNHFDQVFISIRAYDNLNRAFVYKSIEIDNPYSDNYFFTFKNVILVLVLVCSILAAIIYIAIKYFLKLNKAKESDEIELVHRAHHVRMKSEQSP